MVSKVVKIFRTWGEKVDVDKSWHSKGKLAKHRIYLYWSDEKKFPTDEFGFRVPKNFKSFKEKFDASRSKKKIFCFGGSTTWGQYCNYEGTYPHYLEELLGKNYEVFNFGGCDSDSRTEIYVLIDLLRQNYVPDQAIFLDGINEKQAWFSIINNKDSYEEINLHYPYFESLILGREKGFYEKRIKNIFKKITDKINKASQKSNQNYSQKYFHFVEDLSKSYVDSFKVIKKISRQWNIKTFHFLQPTVYDLISENPERYRHIKAFYNNVVDILKNQVCDISLKTKINPLMFIDWQHLNSDGNKKLAKTIFNQIRKS